MAKASTAVKRDYRLIKEAVDPYEIGDRTRSAALLAWFLETAWRMEPEDVPDAICDSRGDKGIDALHVDDDLGEITVFQCKHRAKPGADQGDADLKNLVRAAAYFESVEAIDGLLDSKPNAELVRLLNRLDVRAKVEAGAHTTRVVFVTNGIADPSGRDYVKTLDSHWATMDMWDAPRIARVAERTQLPEFLPASVVLRAAATPTSVSLNDTTDMAIALVPASELAGLPGIDDLSIFDRNVRLGLTRSRVNRELEETVRTGSEHGLFAAYHNGLTILTHGLSIDEAELSLEGLSVVNGCQLLLTLYRNQSSITDELRLLVKIVKVDSGGALPDKITYRTNNQNSVDIRDQRSRDAVQLDLQRQCSEIFGGEFAYWIRRGETTTAERILANETAAQYLMAIYVGEPWNAVRKVRLFEDDYRRIFSREVDAYRLYLISLIEESVIAARENLPSELQSSFAAVKLTIAYLLAQVLRQSDAGARLLEEPKLWLPHARVEVSEKLVELAKDVAVSLKFYLEAKAVEDEESDDPDREPFDPKVLFKSRVGVKGAERDVVQTSRRAAVRDETYLFAVAQGMG